MREDAEISAFVPVSATRVETVSLPRTKKSACGDRGAAWCLELGAADGGSAGDEVASGHKQLSVYRVNAGHAGLRLYEHRLPLSDLMHSACRWWREAAPAANVLGRSALGMLCLRSAHQTGTPPSVSPVPQRGSLARRIGGTRGRGETYSARRVFRFKTKTPATSPSSGVRGPVCAIGSPKAANPNVPASAGAFSPGTPGQRGALD